MLDVRMRKRVGRTQRDAAATFRSQQDDAAGETVGEGLAKRRQIGRRRQRAGNEQELDIRQRLRRIGLHEAGDAARQVGHEAAPECESLRDASASRSARMLRTSGL